MRGLLVKGIAGFYYVSHQDKVYQCKARGIFKKENIVPCVGDEVEFDLLENEEGIINEILPRKNHFIRPPISNVDLFAVVISAMDPEPNLSILDKFLVTAEQAHTEAIICINKVDLIDTKGIKYILDIYEKIYPVIPISCTDKTGIEKLIPYIKNKKTAFAGPSGVGKSTILNSIQEDLSIETGGVSHKTRRGKHTTRHVEIFPMGYGGLAYDTPGFTAFEIKGNEDEQLDWCYPELKPYIGTCRFDNCKHIKEPSCSVINGVKEGKIAKSRYDSYVNQYREINESKQY